MEVSLLYRKYFELCKSKEQYLGRGFLKVNSRFAVFSTSLYLFYLTLTKTGMEYDRANFYSIIARIVLTETSMAVLISLIIITGTASISHSLSNSFKITFLPQLLLKGG